MAAPVIASSSTVADSSNTTSRTISKPSGTASGDWLVLIVGSDGNGGITTPTGFTKIFGATAITSTVEAAIYIRKADGTEGTTFTITTTDSEGVSACCLRITGGDSTDIIEGLSSFLGEMGAAPNIRCPLVYSSTADTLVVRIGISDGGSGTTLTDPAGTTNVCHLGAVAASARTAVAYSTKAATGYVDSAYFANSATTEECLGFTLVLRSSSSESFPDQPVIKCMSVVTPTASNTVEFQKPYGTAEDDLLLAQRVADDSGAFSTMTGFTSLYASSNGTDVYHYIDYKKAGASEGSTYPAFGAISNAQQGALLRIVNQDTTTPINTSSVATGTNATPTASTITPSVDNCLLLWAVGADDDDQTWDTGYPSGYTGVYSTANQEGLDSTLMLALKTQTTQTATGSVSGTLDATEQWIAANIAIAPVAGSSVLISVPLNNSPTATGLAPTVLTPRTISVPANTSPVVTGTITTVSVSDNQLISVPLNSSPVVTGTVPVVSITANQLIAVPSASVTSTGLVPVVTTSDNQVFSIPLNSSPVVTGLIPTITASADITVLIPLNSSPVATGLVPTVTTTEDILVAVPKGTIRVFGKVVSVLATGNATISVPLNSSPVVTGFAPTVVTPSTVQVPLNSSPVVTGLVVSVITPHTIPIPVQTEPRVTGFTPVILTTGNVSVEVPLNSSPTVAGQIATVAATNNLLVRVPVQDNAIVLGTAPTVVTTENLLITLPMEGRVIFGGRVPTVIASNTGERLVKHFWWW